MSMAQLENALAEQQRELLLGWIAEQFVRAGSGWMLALQKQCTAAKCQNKVSRCNSWFRVSGCNWLNISFMNSLIHCVSCSLTIGGATWDFTKVLVLKTQRAFCCDWATKLWLVPTCKAYAGGPPLRNGKAVTLVIEFWMGQMTWLMIWLQSECHSTLEFNTSKEGELFHGDGMWWMCMQVHVNIQLFFLWNETHVYHISWTNTSIHTHTYITSRHVMSCQVTSRQSRYMTFH